MAIDPDVQARLDALVAQGETKGCVNLSELSDIMQEAGLDDEQSHELHEHIEARGVELSDDCGHVDVANLRYANDNVAVVVALAALRDRRRRVGRPVISVILEVDDLDRLARGQDDTADVVVGVRIVAHGVC